MTSSIHQQPHLRRRRVLCKDDGMPITRQGAWSRVRDAAQRANLPTGSTSGFNEIVGWEAGIRAKSRRALASRAMP